MAGLKTIWNLNVEGVLGNDATGLHNKRSICPRFSSKCHIHKGMLRRKTNTVSSVELQSTIAQQNVTRSYL